MDDIKGLVPEIYYDMIARVAAGVPLVAIIYSPTLDELEKISNGATFILLFGLGYLAGHLLTSISSIFNLAIWNFGIVGYVEKRRKLEFKFPSHNPIDVFDVIYRRIDWAANKDANAGAIMKKMDAGATLSDSLFSAWIFIMTYQLLGGAIRWPWGIDHWHWILLIIIGFSLLFTAYMRRITFIVRQDRLLQQMKYRESSPGVPA